MGGKRKELAEWALQRCGRGSKGSRDEEQVFIRDGEMFSPNAPMPSILTLPIILIPSHPRLPTLGKPNRP